MKDLNGETDYITKIDGTLNELPLFNCDALNGTVKLNGHLKACISSSNVTDSGTSEDVDITLKLSDDELDDVRINGCGDPSSPLNAQLHSAMGSPELSTSSEATLMVNHVDKEMEVDEVAIPSAKLFSSSPAKMSETHIYRKMEVCGERNLPPQHTFPSLTVHSGSSVCREMDGGVRNLPFELNTPSFTMQSGSPSTAMVTEGEISLPSELTAPSLIMDSGSPGSREMDVDGERNCPPELTAPSLTMHPRSPVNGVMDIGGERNLSSELAAPSLITLSGSPVHREVDVDGGRNLTPELTAPSFTVLSESCISKQIGIEGLSNIQVETKINAAEISSLSKDIEYTSKHISATDPQKENNALEEAPMIECSVDSVRHENDLNSLSCKNTTASDEVGVGIVEEESEQIGKTSLSYDKARMLSPNENAEQNVLSTDCAEVSIIHCDDESEHKVATSLPADEIAADTFYEKAEIITMQTSIMAENVTHVNKEYEKEEITTLQNDEVSLTEADKKQEQDEVTALPCKEDPTSLSLGATLMDVDEEPGQKDSTVIPNDEITICNNDGELAGKGDTISCSNGGDSSMHVDGGPGQNDAVIVPQDEINIIHIDEEPLGKGDTTSVDSGGVSSVHVNRETEQNNVITMPNDTINTSLIDEEPAISKVDTTSGDSVGSMHVDGETGQNDAINIIIIDEEPAVSKGDTASCDNVDISAMHVDEEPGQNDASTMSSDKLNVTHIEKELDCKENTPSFRDLMPVNEEPGQKCDTVASDEVSVIIIEEEPDQKDAVISPNDEVCVIQDESQPEILDDTNLSSNTPSQNEKSASSGVGDSCLTAPSDDIDEGISYKRNGQLKRLSQSHENNGFRKKFKGMENDSQETKSKDDSVLIIELESAEETETKEDKSGYDSVDDDCIILDSDDAKDNITKGKDQDINVSNQSFGITTSDVVMAEPEGEKGSDSIVQASIGVKLDEDLVNEKTKIKDDCGVSSTLNRKDEDIKNNYLKSEDLLASADLSELQDRPKTKKMAVALTRLQQMFADGLDPVSIAKMNFIEEDQELTEMTDAITKNITEKDFALDSEDRPFTQKSLRDFITQRVCEMLLCNSVIGRIHQKSKANEEAYKAVVDQYATLKKQYQNVIHIIKRLMDERKAAISVEDKHRIYPLKITRSVGLQVCSAGSMYIRSKAGFSSMSPSTSKDKIIELDEDSSSQSAPRSLRGISSPAKPVNSSHQHPTPSKLKPLTRQPNLFDSQGSPAIKHSGDVVIFQSPQNNSFIVKQDQASLPSQAISKKLNKNLAMPLATARKSSAPMTAKIIPASIVQTVYTSPPVRLSNFAKKGTTAIAPKKNLAFPSPVHLTTTLANKPGISLSPSHSNNSSSSSEIIDLTDKDDENAATLPTANSVMASPKTTSNILLMSKPTPRHPVTISRTSAKMLLTTSMPTTKSPFKNKLQLANNDSSCVPVAFVSFTTPNNNLKTPVPHFQMLQLKSETNEGKVTVNGITPDCISLPRDDTVPGRSISSLLARFPKGSHNFAFDPYKSEVVLLATDYYKHLPFLPVPKGHLSNLPPEPRLKVCKNPLGPGIMLSWNYPIPADYKHEVVNYQIYALHEDVNEGATKSKEEWSKVGDVAALPLPMACTLVQFASGIKYYFAVRGQDSVGRLGPFSYPAAILMISADAKMNSLPRVKT